MPLPILIALVAFVAIVALALWDYHRLCTRDLSRERTGRRK